MNRKKKGTQARPEMNGLAPEGRTGSGPVMDKGPTVRSSQGAVEHDPMLPPFRGPGRRVEMEGSASPTLLHRMAACAAL